MPSFLLQAKVDLLENVEAIRPKSNANWLIDVENDAHEKREGITVCSSDEIELEGSRGTANFVVTFQKSHPAAYIKLDKLVAKKHGDGSIRAADKWTTLLVLECRGLTPTKAYPGMDFDIKTTGDKPRTFDDADFTSESDWAEYDDDNDLSVQVQGLVYRVIKE